MAPAMPCKRSPNGITKVTAKPETASKKNSQTVCGCMVESHESTRQRVESSHSGCVRLTKKQWESMEKQLNLSGKNVPGCSSLSILQEIQKILGEKEHSTRRVEGRDHLPVNVQ